VQKRAFVCDTLVLHCSHSVGIAIEIASANESSTSTKPRRRLAIGVDA
jgi:hypothetical protein